VAALSPPLKEKAERSGSIWLRRTA